jgi:RNA-directed DNA polymerase
MSLADSLLELNALTATPDDVVVNRARIEAILKGAAKLAEADVLRFFVASRGAALFAVMGDELRARDPKARLATLGQIDLFTDRGGAAKLLRVVFKDPDSRVRSRARKLARALGLADVALRDTRFTPRGKIKRTTPGAFNPTGWAFGVYGRKRRRPKPREEMAASGLPCLDGFDGVLALLGVPSEAALRPLMRPGAGPGSPYVEFEIPKATGGVRTITAPRAALREVQRAILDAILSKVPTHDASHAFTNGRSIVTNAAPHQKKRIVVKLDLVDFFPSIHYRRVVGIFEQLGYGASVAKLLASLTTFRPKSKENRTIWPGLLPQGAPTSPAIANLAARRLDRRLAALAKKSGAAYSRYADDLTFSFEQEPQSLGRFLWWVDQICQQEGFVENTKKRRVLRNKSQQRVAGVVVNDGLHLPRAERRRFRAILANVAKHGLESQARGRDDFAAYLRGYAAFWNMVEPQRGGAILEQVESLLADQP